MGILKLHQTALLKADLEECMQLLHSFDMSKFENDKVMETIFGIKLPDSIRSLISALNEKHLQKKDYTVLVQ